MSMAKNTMGTKLPRKLEQKMALMGEQIARVLYALQLDDDLLLIAKEDTLGRNLQDLSLKHRQRASKKE